MPLEAQAQPVSDSPLTVEFWPGFTSEVSTHELRRNQLTVKGVSYDNPLRCLEIFCDYAQADSKLLHNWLDPHLTYGGARRTGSGYRRTAHASRPLPSLKELFLPRIPGSLLEFGPDIYQPPYCWRDSDAQTLALNFTYSTNAVYRILRNLSIQNRLPSDSVTTLLDRACYLIVGLFKEDNGFLLKHTNNNFSMYLVPKVIECLLGKSRYDADRQESEITGQSLRATLTMAREYVYLTPMEKVGLSLAKGVSFVEDKVITTAMTAHDEQDLLDSSHQYYARALAVDHRHQFLEMIENRGRDNNRFELVAIVDDTAETVDDLLWMQDLLRSYPFMTICVLVNTAQVSVNFSFDMLDTVLRSPLFTELASLAGSRFMVKKLYCPLISFQSNLFQERIQQIIDRADAIYIKGANFFETCQFKDKDTFYGFVVYGAVSRKYTGLQDYDAVFAYVPAGRTGYRHATAPLPIIPLSQVVASPTTGAV